jgi:hypothetical protein
MKAMVESAKVAAPALSGVPANTESYFASNWCPRKSPLITTKAGWGTACRIAAPAERSSG